MKALVVHCHPRPESFTAAVRDVVLARLSAAGADVRLIDLYARGFDPVLSAGAHAAYEDAGRNRAGIEGDVEALLWADTLIFVYPTWWYGPPAMLKGWLERTFVPGVAFHLPVHAGADIRPGLRHVRRLAVFTTCGASRLLTWWIGAPGRRTILRGLGLLCHPLCRKTFVAQYSMDTTPRVALTRHLDRVAAAVDGMTGGTAGRGTA